MWASLIIFVPSSKEQKKALVGRQPNLFFLLFLVDLMFVTTVATSLYLYFKLCAKFSLWLQENSKLVTSCPEPDYVCLREKILVNHRIMFLIWMFMTVCSIQLSFTRLFWVFWFELQKYFFKIIFSLLFCFSQLLSLFLF